MAIFPDEGQLSKSPKRRSSDVAGRRVRARAMAFMAIALAAGLTAAYLITEVLSKRAVQEVRAPMSKVVVAGADLPLATTITPENAAVIDWPADSLPPGSFTDPKAVEGRVTANAMVRGELVVETRLAAKGSGEGIAAVVPLNMRIMAVKVNDVSGLFGWLHPGDFVDVITTMQQPIGKSGENVYRSKIVLQNITVKAVGEELVTQNAKPVKVPVVILLVTPEQSERLALAATHGELQLTMRSGVDHAEIDTPGVSPIDLLGPMVGAPPLVAAAAPQQGPVAGRGRPRPRPTPAVTAAPPPKREGDVVEILRGDVLSERKLRAKEQP
ncbi:MAG: Flp pilus assembly protein CpaB [Myxococcales bacterium]|nr:Flp pilus assembly protein CpaB [Myxococcales bacterium]